jgi:molecular chaperone GrpE
VSSRPEPDFPESPFERGPGGVGENGDADAADPNDFAEQVDAVETAAEEILTDVVALTAERDEYLSALQRAQADFANYRKRVVRQQEEQGNRAALDLVAKLLPVLDTLDLAVAHLDKADEGELPSTEAQSLRQARTLLIHTLSKEGLERVDEEGVPFDPSVHDAVAHAPEADDEGEPGATVEEVLRSGYRWRGQMLRPAMVRVRG